MMIKLQYWALPVSLAAVVFAVQQLLEMVS